MEVRVRKWCQRPHTWHSSTVANSYYYRESLDRPLYVTNTCYAALFPSTVDKDITRAWKKHWRVPKGARITLLHMRYVFEEKATPIHEHVTLDINGTVDHIIQTIIDDAVVVDTDLSREAYFALTLSRDRWPAVFDDATYPSFSQWWAINTTTPVPKVIQQCVNNMDAMLRLLVWVEQGVSWTENSTMGAWYANKRKAAVRQCIATLAPLYDWDTDEQSIVHTPVVSQKKQRTL